MWRWASRSGGLGRPRGSVEGDRVGGSDEGAAPRVRALGFVGVGGGPGAALGPPYREGGKPGPAADGTTLALGSQPQACRIVAHGRRAGRAGCATRKTTSFVWGSEPSSQCTGPGGVVFESCPMASIMRRQIAAPAMSPSSQISSARLALSNSALLP